MSSVNTILAIGAALVVLCGATSCLAEASDPESPSTLWEGASPVLEGASLIGAPSAQHGGGQGSSPAMSSVMAMKASQHSEINRVRATMGGGQYNPQTVCDSNVNIGSTQTSKNPFVPNVTYAGSTIVVTGGDCAAQSQPAPTNLSARTQAAK